MGLSVFAIDSLFHRNYRKVQKDYWVTLFAVVLPILSIIPISLSYVLYSIVWYARAWQFRLIPSWLHVICLSYSAAELATLTYLWTVWLRKRRITQAPIVPDETLISVLSKIFAMQTFTGDDFSDDSLDAAEREAEAFRNRLIGWFFKCPFEKIKRDNVIAWLAWSAYNKQVSEMTDAQMRVCEKSLQMVEERCLRQFPIGRNKKVKSLRLTLDPIPFVPRPLLFYLVVYALNAFVWLELREMHYDYVPIQSGTYTLEFYHKQGTKSTPALEDSSPILFFHGLGMGIAQYQGFIRHLNRAFPHREIFIMAQGQTSMMPTHPNYCNPPDSRTTVKAITKLAEIYKIKQKGGWIILSHSFGTITHAWIIKHVDAQLATRNIMVDPVCFRLWESDVCYNFLYRRPRNSVQLLISYFVGKELGIAYSLHRAFWWTDNLLLADDILDRYHERIKFIAYCGGTDEIINAPSVKQYLEAEGVNVKYYSTYPHGKLLDHDFDGGQGFHDIMRSIRYGLAPFT